MTSSGCSTPFHRNYGKYINGCRAFSENVSDLRQQEADKRGEMWVLKKEVHRGKGVHVLPLKKAIEEGKVRQLDSNYDLAQAYIANQLMVLGRKFYVR